MKREMITNTNKMNERKSSKRSKNSNRQKDNRKSIEKNKNAAGQRAAFLLLVSRRRLQVGANVRVAILPDFFAHQNRGREEENELF
jgi:hypothetical protein